MNSRYCICLLLLGLDFLIACACAANDQPFIDSQLPSPDGTMTARMTFVDDEYRLIITGKHGAGIEGTKPIDAFPLAMRWSKDSQTIILVSHLVGASEALVFHRNDDKWVCLDAGLHLAGLDGYSLVEIADDGSSQMRFTYKVCFGKPKGKFGRFALCRFTMNCSSGKRSKVVISGIDFDSYQSLSFTN